MHRLTRERIQGLATHVGSHCVSVYMPTHRAGPEVRQDPIRLKNLTTEAARTLEGMELSGEEIEAILDPITRLIDDRGFWRDQLDGLALLADDRGASVFKLPIPVEPMVVVGRRFHVKPLIPLVAHNGRFFILALSRHRVRLYEATRFTTRELDTDDIPASLSDAVGYDRERRSLQFHSSTPTSTGARAAEFHGQAVGKDDSDGELERFLQLVARGVEGLIGDPNLPLVLAAVDELVGEFSKHVRHVRLADDFVRGNPDDLPEQELHARAWRAVEPLFERRRRSAAKRARARLVTGRALQRVEDVVVAAADGRVEELFVADDVARWGLFTPERRRVEIHASPEPADEDLLNRAAIEALNHDGTVFVVPSGEVPADGSPVAAALRY